jgi:hypothetical protein
MKFVIFIKIFITVFSLAVCSKKNHLLNKNLNNEDSIFLTNAYNYINSKEITSKLSWLSKVDDKINYVEINNDYEVSFEKTNSFFINAEISRTLLKEGWNRLKVTSNDQINKNPFLHSYFSGILESSLTFNDISNFWFNMQNNNRGLSKRREFWVDINGFFREVGNNILSKLEKNDKIHESLETQYSNELYLGFFQLLGIHDGYNYIANEKNLEKIKLSEFLTIQADGEISELTRMLSYKKNPKKFRIKDRDYFNNAFGIDLHKDDLKTNFMRKNFNARMNIRNDRCSAMVKLIRENNDVNGKIHDIFVGHVTWSDFTESIKYLKNYDLNFTLNEKRPAKISFSSYPACVSSTDDFYISSNKIAVVETTLDVYNLNLYKNAKSSNEYIPNFMRVNTSTMFSKTAKEWVDSFKKYNTGTYSSQWIVTDYNVFDKIKNTEESLRKIELNKKVRFRVSKVSEKLLEISNGLTMILEQTPGNIISHDVSKHILINSYYSGFNKAFFQETNRDLDTALLEEIYGEELKHSDRGEIFNKLEKNVENMKTFKDILMYNGFKKGFSDRKIDNSKYRKTSEDPSFDNPSHGISSRYDLSIANMPFGGTDFKMTSSKMINVGDWGLGIGDWGLGPIPNPQSPIPNPHDL